VDQQASFKRQMVGSIPTGGTVVHLVGTVFLFIILGIIAANKYDDIQMLNDVQGIVIVVIIAVCVLALYGVELPL